MRDTVDDEKDNKFIVYRWCRACVSA